jgi:hypothetical protein
MMISAAAALLGCGGSKPEVPPTVEPATEQAQPAAPQYIVEPNTTGSVVAGRVTIQGALPKTKKIEVTLTNPSPKGAKIPASLPPSQCEPERGPLGKPREKDRYKSPIELPLAFSGSHRRGEARVFGPKYAVFRFWECRDSEVQTFWRTEQNSNLRFP